MKVLYMMAFALDSEATHHQAHIPDYAKVDEIPFDFERRIMSVVVRTPEGVSQSFWQPSGLLSSFRFVYRWSALRCDHRLLSDSPSGWTHPLPQVVLTRRSFCQHVGAIYLLLAVRFWFRVPAVGIAIGTGFLFMGWMAYNT